MTSIADERPHGATSPEPARMLRKQLLSAGQMNGNPHKSHQPKQAQIQPARKHPLESLLPKALS